MEKLSDHYLFFLERKLKTMPKKITSNGEKIPAMHLTSTLETKSLADNATENLWQQITEIDDENTLLDINKLLEYPNYKAYLFECLKSYGFSDWDSINELINSQSGKQ